MTDPKLIDLPPRARVGYILRESTVKQGELTPSIVAGILRHKRLDVSDDEDEALELIADVMRHNPHVDWGGE